MTKPKWKKEVYGMMKQLECVRCESRIGLGPYTISYQQYAGTTRSGNVRTTHYKVHSFPIPICAECRKKLDNWKTLNGLLKGFFFLGFFVLLYGIIFVVLNVVVHLFIFPINLPILGIVVGIILIIVFSLLSHKNNGRDFNPQQYMKMGPDLIPLVKPRNSYWVKFDNWANEVINKRYNFLRDQELEEVDNIHLCPRCGMPNPLRAKFCTDCGYDLN